MDENGHETKHADIESQSDSAPSATLVSAVASSLAGLILVDNVKKGQKIEIPSLGITLTKDDLREPDAATTEKRN